MGMLHFQYSFIVLIPYGNLYKTLHFFSNGHMQRFSYGCLREIVAIYVYQIPNEKLGKSFVGLIYETLIFHP